MTNRLTKSTRKLRTTAVASLVAVSTAFTLVTPANAEEVAPTVPVNTVNSNVNPDPTKAAGLNIYDGSKLPKGTVKDEAGLKAATDSVAWTIKVWTGQAVEPAKGKDKDYTLDAQKVAGLIDDEQLGKVFGAYGNPAAIDLTEHGALEALTDQFNAVTALLQTAAQNQADAQASVNAALAADQAARDAWLKVIQYFASLSVAQRVEINSLLEAVNKQNKTAVPDFDLLPILTTVTPEEALHLVDQIIDHRQNVEDHIDADRNKKDFVSRDYVKALDALVANKTVKGFMDPFNAAKDALLAAQRTDVIPMELFLERARAQVLVLREIQAKYAVAVRLIQLYENDPISNDGHSVKDAYVALGKNLMTRINAEAQELTQADSNAATLYKGWEEDLGNSYITSQDQEEAHYEAFRKSAAKRIYLDIVADRTWQNNVEKAQNLDRQYFGQAAAAKPVDTSNAEANQAALDALSKKVAEAAKSNGELQSQVNKLADALAKNADKNNGDNGKNDGDNGKNDGDNHKNVDNDKEDGDFPLVPVAIAGVILAIIAAIAANFPALAALMKH